jgi:hypothetical protein
MIYYAMEIVSVSSIRTAQRMRPQDTSSSLSIFMCLFFTRNYWHIYVVILVENN